MVKSGVNTSVGDEEKQKTLNFNVNLFISKEWLLKLNPGRFAPITCSPRVDSPRVVSPRKVSRFASLNRYYIIIDEVFLDNFLVIIDLLVVCKKKIIHSFWSTLSKISSETFLAKFTKNHTRTVKRVGYFCTNAKMHEMTKMLYKCANNLFFNELRIKC